MGLLGAPVRRVEDRPLLVGDGRYVADLVPDDALHAAFVRSMVAHGTLVDIDATEALAAPGVVAVLAAADLDLSPVAPSIPALDQAMVRTWLATDRVRYVGEPVAVVLAETPAEAADAVDLVVVDVDPLPAVVGFDAARSDDVLLHPEAGTNRCYSMGGEPDPHFFDGCDVVVELSFDNPRMNVAPIEPRAAIARWDADEEGDLRLTQWSCTQFPHRARDVLAEACGVDAASVRVITPEVGGGFGGKNGGYPEDLVVARASRHVGRPVAWVETRSESMLGIAHGRGLRFTAALGGDRDGRLVAYRLHMDQDAGAYPGIGAFLPVFGQLMATGPYTIERIEFSAESWATSTVPVGAYRGAGRPEATHALERVVDAYAAEVGLDAAELRRRNFVPADAFPYTTPSRQTYDSGDYEGALDKVLAAVDVDALRTEQDRRRADPAAPLLGLGFCAYVEITNPLRASEFGSVEVRPDGSVLVLTGSSAHGQGHHTTYAQVAADVLGIGFDRIEVRHGDTDEVARGGGTGGSRSLQAGGSAVLRAGEMVVDEARRLAAELLEAHVDDVVLASPAEAGGSGAFTVAGSPSIRLDWSDVAAAAADRDDRLAAETDFEAADATFPFGVHASVVEVDRETGRVTVVRHVCCDDAGVIVNPTVVDGQVHGGVAGGIAHALMEEFRYDQDGTPLSGNFMDYAIPSAAELPPFERIVQETPTDLNPLGVKGIGEAGTIGATPAVQNAVVDALAHLGVRHVEMPLTSQRVWRTMAEAAD